MKSLHFGSAVIDIITLVAPENIERASFWNDGKAFLMLETGRKVAAEAITSHVGGGACNTAVCLARRGWAVGVRARVGDDLNAREVRAHLAREGVADRMVVSDEATGTAVMIASHDRNAAIFVHRGANEALAPDDLPDLAGLDLVYVAPLSGRSADCLPEIARRGHAAGAMVAVNPGIRHLSSRGPAVLAALGDVDLVSLNRVEAEALVPMLAERAVCAEPPLPPDPPALLDRWLSAGGFDIGLLSFLRTLRGMGPRWVLVTDGTGGAYLAGPDGVLWHPALKVRVAGTAGAGDGFTSTLAAALTEGADAETALRQAAAVAASVVAHVDTTTGLLTPEGMTAALAGHGDVAVRNFSGA